MINRFILRSHPVKFFVKKNSCPTCNNINYISIILILSIILVILYFSSLGNWENKHKNNEEKSPQSIVQKRYEWEIWTAMCVENDNTRDEGKGNFFFFWWAGSRIFWWYSISNSINLLKFGLMITVHLVTHIIICLYIVLLWTLSSLIHFWVWVFEFEMLSLYERNFSKIFWWAG